VSAVVTIRRWTGPENNPTKTDITGQNTRCNAEDRHTASGTTNPTQVPSSGLNYSYWVTLRLYCSETPAGAVTNIRLFLEDAGDFGPGITFKGQSATSYTTAKGIPGKSGDPLNTQNYPGLSADPVPLNSFTPQAPKLLGGLLANPSTGDFGDFFVFQVEVGPSAIIQPSQATLTFKYDET
jgi:hypothetical protein